MRTRLPRCLILILWLSLGARAAALEPSDLCTGNPCRVAQSFLVAEDVLLDFGPAVTLVLAPRVQALLAADAHLTLRAGTIELSQGSGAKALGSRTGLRLEAASGDLRTVGRAAFRLRDAELLDLSAATDADLDVSIDVRSKGQGTRGGDVTLEAGGDLTLAGKVNASGDASGADPASGGRLWIVARGGALSSSATVYVRSNSGTGGEVELHSSGPMTLGGKLDLSARREPGAGGDLRLVSEGDILISGTVRTRGRGETAPPSEAIANCGDGGDISISSRGRVALASRIDIRGGFNCAGGLVTVQAEQGVTQSAAATVDALTAGAFGTGGRIEVYTTRSDIVIAGRIRLRAVRGGALLLQAAQGEITVEAGADLGADSSGGPRADPGVVAMAADCGLRVEAGARIDVRSADNAELDNRGIVELSVEQSGSLVIDGSVRAAGAVRLWHVDSSAPQLTGVIQPAPEIEVRPANPASCS